MQSTQLLLEGAVESNEGLDAATGDYLVCLDENVALGPYWLAHLTATANLDTHMGMSGPSLAIGPPDQAIQSSYSSELEREQFIDARTVDYAGVIRGTANLSSSCLFMTRRCLDTLGGFDPQFVGQELADRDYSLRAIGAGLKLVVVDTVYVENSIEDAKPHESTTSSYDRQLFEVKYGGHATSSTEILAVIDGCENLDSQLHIPLSLHQRCAPNAEPLPILGSPNNRILMIPNWDEQSWIATFEQLVHLINNDKII